jgi:pimeloyl-ACP methyl ester carboxylesterase
MKILSRFLLWLVIALVGVYLFGPQPPKPKLNRALPVVTSDLNILEKQILDHEKSFKLKPDNGARFIWRNDTVKGKTEFVLLYLHGFSACWYEGNPVNTGFARYFGCNAYFPRLASHGIDTTEALVDMTPDRLWESAKEALAVASQLGQKVVIMSTSTGGTLALKLAAEFPERIHGLILFSPNVKINNSMAWMLSLPWGLQIARKNTGSNYRVWSEKWDSKECQYWNCKYRLEGVVYLQQLVETTMKEKVFRKVKVPVFLGYYYKDDEHQDKTIRVDAALKMFDRLGTPLGLKKKQAFPDAGDHCIACELYSKSVDEVRQATFAFAEEVLRMMPAVK